MYVDYFSTYIDKTPQPFCSMYYMFSPNTLISPTRLHKNCSHQQGKNFFTQQSDIPSHICTGHFNTVSIEYHPKVPLHKHSSQIFNQKKKKKAASKLWEHLQVLDHRMLDEWHAYTPPPFPNTKMTAPDISTSCFSYILFLQLHLFLGLVNSFSPSTSCTTEVYLLPSTTQICWVISHIQTQGLQN